MADTRINALVTSTVSLSDDFLPIDGTTAGTKKLSAFSPSFGGNATVGGTLTVSGSGTSAFNGPVTITTAAGNSYLRILAPAGQSPNVQFYKNAVAQMTLGYDLTGAVSLMQLYDNVGGAVRLSVAQSTGNTTVAGTLTVSSTAASSSTITGALVVGSGGSGGLGVAGAIFAGGNLTNGEYHLTNGTSTHARSVYALSGTGKVEIGYGPTGYGFGHPTGSYIAYADTFYIGAIGATSAALSLSAGGILSSSVGTGGVGTQLVLNNNATNATGGRGSALVYTGTGDANLASIESQTATASNNTGKLVIKTSNAGTLAIAATYDENGNLIQKVNGTAPSLAVNSTMTFELTSNTSLKIFVRGSDGTTRSTTLTLA